MPQYAVLNRDPQFPAVITWLVARNIAYQLHLNRTRFHIESSVQLTEFLITWGTVCTPVPDLQDLITGHSLLPDQDLGG